MEPASEAGISAMRVFLGHGALTPCSVRGGNLRLVATVARSPGAVRGDACFVSIDNHYETPALCRRSSERRIGLSRDRAIEISSRCFWSRVTWVDRSVFFSFVRVCVFRPRWRSAGTLYKKQGLYPCSFRDRVFDGTNGTLQSDGFIYTRRINANISEKMFYRRSAMIDLIKNYDGFRLRWYAGLQPCGLRLVFI